MKKNLTVGLLMLMGVAFFSCSSNTNTATQPEVEVDENTIVLSDGQTTVSWLKDNEGHRMMNRDLFQTAPDSLFELMGLQEGIPSSVSTFLMHADGEWILFDTGLGAERKGLLLEDLKTYNLTPDSIDYIYITHFHGDHIGGMVAEGKPVFPNAKVYAGAVEYKAWVEDMPEDRNAMQREVMGIYKDQLTLFQFGDVLPHDVKAIDAVGHTPGHTAFQKGNLLVIGDLMHGAALQMVHPEFNANFDMDKEQAAASRKRLLDYARENHLIMAGMHLPEPAFISMDE